MNKNKLVSQYQLIFIIRPSQQTIKKRHLDSHRSTVTTQTQNKTRQNYYAILPVDAGEASSPTYIYSHTY